jgi:hypothetical protein
VPSRWIAIERLKSRVVGHVFAVGIVPRLIFYPEKQDGFYKEVLSVFSQDQCFGNYFGK